MISFDPFDFARTVLKEPSRLFEKRRPKNFSASLCRAIIPYRNFVLFFLSPALQASLGRDMKNKTHSPEGRM
jgi:hypothetical protein